MNIRTRASRAVAALPPPLRWRVRNAVAFGRWVRLAAGSGGKTGDVYGEEFWEGEHADDWAGLAALMFRYCAPASVVDVGCGDGRLLAAVRALDGGARILGVDSSPAALARVRLAGVPSALHDLSSWRARDAARLMAEIAGFDVVVSLETGEHLPPWAGPRFIRALAQGRMAIFSAAQPGQGGTLHMNERPFDYWRGQFETCGFRPSECDAEFRAAVAALDLPWWYAANIHVFERATR
jgi:SAM-dependent methyltransferase